VVLADEDGGIRITAHEWLSAIHRFRSSRAGARAAREALENSLRLGRIVKSWSEALMEVLRGDSFLAGWEGTPDLSSEHRPTRKALRISLWDLGVLQLGGNEGYPQWVPGSAGAEGRFRLGGIPLHPGTVGGFPCPVNLLPGESQHRINRPMVRKMGAVGAGRPTGWTEQQGWLLEVQSAKCLGRNEAASLWAEWESVYQDFLGVHGLPHQHRSRILAVRGEMPHKVYERRVRGGLESAVADPSLRGKGLGGVRFVRSDELKGRAALRNEQILRYWAEDLLVLDQPVHISECPLADALFQFGQENLNWPLTHPKVTSAELQEVHGWSCLAVSTARGGGFAVEPPGDRDKVATATGATADECPGGGGGAGQVEPKTLNEAEASDDDLGWGTGDEGEHTPRQGASGPAPGRG
jgi:hypothetical protein